MLRLRASSFAAFIFFLVNGSANLRFANLAAAFFATRFCFFLPISYKTNNARLVSKVDEYRNDGAIGKNVDALVNAV
jgi:hypothetical protein